MKSETHKYLRELLDQDCERGLQSSLFTVMEEVAVIGIAVYWVQPWSL